MLCRALGGKYSGELSCSVNDKKQSIEELMNKWILEVPELESLHSSRSSGMKAFIVREVDSGRPAYGRSVEVTPRQCVFIGTVNPSGDRYLKDMSGNRRYWIVEVGIIDIERFKRDRDQLFAEAVCLYKKGEKLYIEDLDVIRTATSVQAEKLDIDPWIAPIQEYLITIKEGESVFLADIFKYGLDSPVSRMKRSDVRRVRALMEFEFKWLKTQKKIGMYTRAEAYIMNPDLIKTKMPIFDVLN